jgi:hypothetical protein
MAMGGDGAFHKCKGTAANERSSKGGGRRKALKSRGLNPSVFLRSLFFQAHIFGAPKFRTLNSGPDLMEQAKLGIQKVHHLLSYLPTYLPTYLPIYLII